MPSARWPPAGLASPAGGLGEDHRDLGAQQDAEDLPGDVDAEQAQDGDDGPRAERERPPRPVDPEVRGGLAGGGRAERPVQADLEERVRQQRDQGGADPGDPAQARR